MSLKNNNNYPISPSSMISSFLAATGGGEEIGFGGVGAGGEIGFTFLSPFDNMIPERVPVKNVAIGIINSKNLESIGAIAPIG